MFFSGFYLALRCFTGFYWFSTGFDSVSLSVMGFTGSYWTLIGFRCCTGFNGNLGWDLERYFIISCNSVLFIAMEFNGPYWLPGQKTRSKKNSVKVVQWKKPFLWSLPGFYRVSFVNQRARDRSRPWGLFAVRRSSFVFHSVWLPFHSERKANEGDCLRSIGFYWVFTGFYRVSMGSTGFYWFLLGFLPMILKMNSVRSSLYSIPSGSTGF